MIRIINLSGKEVYRTPAISKMMNFQLNTLSSGMYLVTLENNGAIGRKKRIIE